MRVPTSQSLALMVRRARSGPIISTQVIFGLVVAWLGTLAGAITLLANTLTPVEMADWLWSLVGPWQDWTPEFWALFAGGIGFALPSSLIPSLNVAGALLVTAGGARMIEHDTRNHVAFRYPLLQLTAGLLAVVAIGYLMLPGQAQADDRASMASLTIFLAAAAASFSPFIAGGGNLIKRLWLMLVVTGLLLVLNELSRIGSS